MLSAVGPAASGADAVVVLSRIALATAEQSWRQCSGSYKDILNISDHLTAAVRILSFP